MKAIILAGGLGTRFMPCTKVTNKHLLPVYNQPMIYYPISTLAKAGFKDIIILTGEEHSGHFVNLLTKEEKFSDIKFTFEFQKGAGGIAEALGICKERIGNDSMVVILGDNIFEDDISEWIDKYKKNPPGARIFLKEVHDPERFGVAIIKDKKILKIVEKPNKPGTNLAVTGLYIYDSNVWSIIDSLKPSGRGELEITDVNNAYISKGQMGYYIIKKFWSDAGTPDSNLQAANFIQSKIKSKAATK